MRRKGREQGTFQEQREVGEHRVLREGKEKDWEISGARGSRSRAWGGARRGKMRGRDIRRAMGSGRALDGMRGGKAIVWDIKSARGSRRAPDGTRRGRVRGRDIPRAMGSRRTLDGMRGGRAIVWDITSARESRRAWGGARRGRVRAKEHFNSKGMLESFEWWDKRKGNSARKFREQGKVRWHGSM